MIFRSSQVCKIARISERKLQWWTEQGILECRIEGHTRIFTDSEVLLAYVISELLLKGITMCAMRCVLSGLKRAVKATLSGHEQHRGEWFLIFGPHREAIQVVQTHAAVLKCFAQAKSKRAMVELTDAIRDVRGEPRPKPQPVNGRRPFVEVEGSSAWMAGA